MLQSSDSQCIVCMCVVYVDGIVFMHTCLVIGECMCIVFSSVIQDPWTSELRRMTTTTTTTILRGIKFCVIFLGICMTDIWLLWNDLVLLTIHLETFLTPYWHIWVLVVLVYIVIVFVSSPFPFFINSTINYYLQIWLYSNICVIFRLFDFFFLIFL